MKTDEKKPNVNWGPEYEAEVKALEEEEARMKAEAETPPAEPTPAPEEQKPEPPPAEEQAAVPAAPAADDLQKQIAERDARIAELERQVQVEIGRHGGELGFLRNQVKLLQDQIQKKTDTPAAPEPQAEPLIDDEFRREYPELAERLEKLSLRMMAQTEKATKAQKEAQEKELQAERSQEFSTKLYGAVPNFDEINSDPKWVAWLNSRPRGDAKTRLQRANEFAANLEADPLIEMAQDYLASLNPASAPAAAVPVAPEPAKAPASEPARAKPSVASQAVPPLAATPAAVPQQGDPNLTMKRLESLQERLVKRNYDPKDHDKLMREFARLSEAAERGELK